MAEIKDLRLLSKSMRDKVVKAYWGRAVRWKYGMVKPYYGGVRIYLKKGKVRDTISGKVIVEYLGGKG